MKEQTLELIRQQVTENPVVIYMKGTPQFPMCGFSSRAAQALAATGLPFAAVNIFDDENIYNFLPFYQDWPTFPQIYVGGELIGGCDITLEMYESGELKDLMQKAIDEAAK